MNSRTISSKSVYGRGKPAMPALKLMAFENEYHRNIDAQLREIKRLRKEVGMMTKRYNGVRREVKELMEKVRSQPPPTIPERIKDGIAEKEEEIKDRMEIDEERIRQLRTPSPTPPPMSPKIQVKKPPLNLDVPKVPTVQVNATVSVKSQKIATETPEYFRVTNNTELWDEWRNAGPKSKEKSMFNRRGKCLRKEGMDVSWVERDWTNDGAEVYKRERIWLIGPEKEEEEDGYIDVSPSCVARGKCSETERCGSGFRCDWGNKWLVKRIYWCGGDMAIRMQTDEEEEEEEREEEERHEQDEMEYDEFDERFW